MMKFIYLCAAVLILSFTALPVFYGVSDERATILASNEIDQTAPTESSLSFEEIYDIAAQGQDINQENTFDPASLNEIKPAAGVEFDTFPSGFSKTGDAALTDTLIPVEETSIQSE